MNGFPGKLAVQQRVLPNYRAPFFDLLASACDGGMSLFTGLPRSSEGITTTNQLQITNYHLGKNIHLFGGSLYLCYQRGLIDWLEEWNPDALIVEANPRYLSTPSAVNWMHKRDRPVIGWGLGAPPVSSIRESGRAAFLRQFDAMICYSNRGVEEYAKHGYPLDNLFVAHNAVSSSPTQDMPVRPDTFNPSTRLRQSGQAQPVVLFVGRLQFRKNIDLLLGACAEIESQPRLLIVGDGPEREALEELAQEIYPSAEFVGSKHGDELKPYFAKADLFVLPGTGGLAVQEAMSYGLPVIVAQGDGTQDDLVRKENGWQIPPDDFDVLLSTMKDALSDAARLRRMGAESYRIVKEEINIEKMADTFVRALNTLTAK
ncbi:MAG TPA: glycosyltransferase family 4 protein [Anaerolineales bacterium]|nr:glycosyltransferase family 4 protein [Anaerolineales bacterium]